MEEKVRRMAEAMEVPDHSVSGFIAAIEVILDEIHIPKSLSEIGVPLDCAERIAIKALKDSAAKTNPRLASLDEVRVLIETAIQKAR
jgi:alcohol dehydrogenase class IV